MLVILELNGLLGHVNRNIKTFNQHGIYNDTSSLTPTPFVKPVFEDSQMQIFARPNLQYINYELLLKSKKEIDIGIWSSQDRENTQA